MSASTQIISGGLVTFDIKINGSAIPDTMDVRSIEVEKGVNRISVAKVVIIDGSPATQSFQASSSSTFVPGNKMVINTGYDSKNNTIFEGIITKQSIRVNGTEGSVLEVECRDEAVKMIVGRKSVTYANKKDSDIISTIIGNYGGLSADVSATTSTIKRFS